MKLSAKPKVPALVLVAGLTVVVGCKKHFVGEPVGDIAPTEDASVDAEDADSDAG